MSYVALEWLRSTMPFGIMSKHDSRVTAKYSLKEVLGKWVNIQCTCMCVCAWMYVYNEKVFDVLYPGNPHWFNVSRVSHWEVLWFRLAWWVWMLECMYVHIYCTCTHTHYVEGHFQKCIGPLRRRPTGSMPSRWSRRKHSRERKMRCRWKSQCCRGTLYAVHGVHVCVHVHVWYKGDIKQIRGQPSTTVSYTHLTLPTNREV